MIPRASPSWHGLPGRGYPPRAGCPCHSVGRGVRRQDGASRPHPIPGGFHGEDDDETCDLSRMDHRRRLEGDGGDDGPGTRTSPGSTDRPGLGGSECRARPVAAHETAGDGSGPAGAEAPRRPEEGVRGDRGAAKHQDAKGRPRHQGPDQDDCGPSGHQQGSHRGGPGQPPAGTMGATRPDPAPGPGAARLRPTQAGGDDVGLFRPALGRTAQAVRRPGEPYPGDRRGGDPGDREGDQLPDPHGPQGEAIQRGGCPQAGGRLRISGGQGEGSPGRP